MYLCTQNLEIMRPAIDYTLDEVTEFAELKQQTEEAVAKLTEDFEKVIKSNNLNEREAIFALARTVHHFFEEYDGAEIDGRELDAEAAFNDYLLFNMDVSEGKLLDTFNMESSLKGN